MQRHRYSTYADFWKQLQPGYAYFAQYHQPPTVNVASGRYVMNSSPVITQPEAASQSFLALSKVK